MAGSARSPKAAQVLAERWTPLVLRELICGGTRFNDLRRGVPLMSASLLSQRLKFLKQEGVFERRQGAQVRRLLRPERTPLHLRGRQYGRR